MKNIKLTTMAAMSICASIYANGLYFVTGGDFRECYLKYVVHTTNDNQ